MLNFKKKICFQFIITLLIYSSQIKYMKKLELVLSVH